MPTGHWPPPGFPLVRGDYALTPMWTMHLPETFARRVEDGSLVLWRPGLTVWLTAWGNDNDETHHERLEWIREAASSERFDERQSVAGGVTRYSYRLHDRNDDGAVESVSAYVIADDGHLQVSVYFDDVANAAEAQRLVDSIALRSRP